MMINKLVKLPTGEVLTNCILCKRSWEIVTHTKRGLCRGCSRKAEYNESVKQKIKEIQIESIELELIDSIPHKDLLLIAETEKELGYPVTRLTKGSTLDICHKCDICGESKITQFKLFVLGKNLSHIQCKSIKTKDTNIRKYGVTNPLNTKERIEGNTRIKDLEIKRSFENENYTVKDIKRTDKAIIIDYLCAKQHPRSIAWSAWQQGQRCLYCDGNYVGFDEIIASFATENYKLLTPIEEYENNLTSLDYECPKKHHHKTAWKYWQRGCRCPSCTGSTMSKGEKELLIEFASYNPHKNRELIKPLELDLLFEKEKLAIEYCGLYWHSDQHSRMIPSYHYNKMKACEAKGVRLITLFEDEWIENKEICISRINNALGVVEKRIFARKCEVVELDKVRARDFFDQNHLQGSAGCLFVLGLIYKDQLISAMSFGLPSRSHVYKEKKILELKRFASLPSFVVTGGASRLLKKGVMLAKDKCFEEIRSYCDMRWGTGKTYEKLGMRLIGQTHYTPHYTDGIRRYRNQALAPSEGETEQEKVKRKKLYRIYDCGHQTWSLDLSSKVLE